MKKKKSLIIFIVIASPVLLYAIITVILFSVRSDNFVGYYVDGESVVYYQNSYYSQIVDEEKADIAYKYGEGYWTYEEEYISSKPINFPYFEYWLPDIFFAHLLYPGSKDAKYILISTMGSGNNIYYERVEE